jgi:hypothetical protein
MSAMRMRQRTLKLTLVALFIILALGAYATGFGNTALFHHVANPYSDPILDHPMLRCHTLIPRIFTGDFLLTTYGDYRPMGYALFAVVNGFTPSWSAGTWHILLLGLHVLAALLVFSLLRRLTDDLMAFGFAAMYLLHPAFVPLVNDVNMIYLLWGLLFSAATLLLYLVHLQSAKTWPLILSLVAFAASLWTYPYAMVLPAFLTALSLLHLSAPRGAVALLVYFSLLALLSALCKLPPWAVLGGLCVLAFGIGAAAVREQRLFFACAKTLPYFALVGLYLLAAASTRMPLLPAEVLHDLQGCNLVEPFQPAFSSQLRLATSLGYGLALGLAALAPLLWALRKSFRQAAVFALLAALLVMTVLGQRDYRDDVRYWETLSRARPNDPVLQLSVATACVEAKQWEKARDILLHLKYEARVGTVMHQILDAKLGRVFAALGNDKVAGYFCFYEQRGWNERLMKHRFMEIADFDLRVGYISCAEYSWACAQVLSPDDARLCTNLARALIYKNFFRAARKHLLHALQLEPRNATALYYLAFIADLGGDQAEYERCRMRWKSTQPAGAEMSFRPIYDAYHFDRDRMRSWFSPDPLQLFAKYDESAGYRLPYEDRTYEFSEVPLAIGEYFVRRGNDEAAIKFLTLAHDTNPRLRAAIVRLAEAFRRLGRTDEAAHFEQRLKEIPDERTRS